MASTPSHEITLFTHRLNYTLSFIVSPLTLSPSSLFQPTIIFQPCKRCSVLLRDFSISVGFLYLSSGQVKIDVIYVVLRRRAGLEGGG